VIESRLGEAICGPARGLGDRRVLRIGGVEGFELDGRQIAEVAVQALGVVPVHPTEGGEFDLLDGPLRPLVGRPANELGLVVAVHGFGEGVVEAVADGPDRGDRADLREPLAVANRRELRPGVGMQRSPGWCSPRVQRAVSIASSTIGVRICSATRHPTIIRLNASTMKHT
jgi:hypothetical protein